MLAACIGFMDSSGSADHGLPIVARCEIEEYESGGGKRRACPPTASHATAALVLAVVCVGGVKAALLGPARARVASVWREEV